MTEKVPIKAEDLGKFSVDDSNKLYWDGKPIKSENIHLSFWQKFFAVVVAASAALASLTTVNQEYCFINVGNSCKNGNPPEIEVVTQKRKQPD